MSQGVALIYAERQKQMNKGYTPAHDDAEHSVEELLRIATCYLDAAASEMEGMDQDPTPAFWPRESTIPWNPEQNPIGNAVKGAAFAAAAMDLIYHQFGAENSSG